VLAAALCAAASGGAFAEISPMSRERLPEVEQLGRDASRSRSPVIYMDNCRTYPPHAPHMFEVTITTPFTALAFVALESANEGKPVDLTRWPIDSPDKQFVIVAADPTWLKPGGPADVAKVVLRRGDRTIEPSRSDTHQVHSPGGGADQKTYRGGAFYFPLEPFASEKGDLEVVVIVADEAGAEAVVTLSKGQLFRMR